MVKNPPANAGDSRDAGSIPGLGRSTDIGDGNLLQYSFLKNSMYRGALGARIHGMEYNPKSRTSLSNFIHTTSLNLDFIICKTRLK